MSDNLYIYVDFAIQYYICLHFSKRIKSKALLRLFFAVSSAKKSKSSSFFYIIVFFIITILKK